jgi:glucose/arabinose dehydrogenase
MAVQRWLKRTAVVVAVLVVLAIATPAVLVAIGVIPLTTVKLALNALLRPQRDAGAVIAHLQAPPEFQVSLYAGDLAGARFMLMTDAGDLLVSRPRAGEIVLLERDHDGDGLPDGRRVLLRGLDLPHGLDSADGWLYVAEQTAIGRVRFDVKTGRIAGEYAHIVTGFSDGGNHWTRTIRVGPDGDLYLTQGSTCNVCEEKDSRRATMMRFKADGSDGEIYASGLRNSVGFDWAPWTIDGGKGDLYATDNGRDMLGDDFPPCELNRIVEHGFYGWPYANGYNVPDPDFGQDHEEQVQKSLPPAFGFRAHNAPLGMRFLRHAPVAARMERTALVALHGSWNRSAPDGYKVVALRWHADGEITSEDFLTGFFRDGEVLGRPVDVVEDSNGVIYVSDDYNGAIYRVGYGDDQRVENYTPPPSAAVVDNGLAQFSAAELAALRTQGENTFRQYPCANCHEAGVARDGRPVHPLDRIGARYTVETLAAFFIAPTPPMPLFPLSEEQRKALAVYLLDRNKNP